MMLFRVLLIVFLKVLRWQLCEYCWWWFFICS